jgi:predicted nuclease with TOPRIM domain
MSEDLTRKMPNSFEERVLAEFAAMRQELAEQRELIQQLHARVNSIDARLNTLDQRLTSLEEKVDARLHETRPIWEAVRQRLTEIEKGLGTLNRRFKLFVNDAFDLRSRVERLEDEQAAHEG